MEGRGEGGVGKRAREGKSREGEEQRGEKRGGEDQGREGRFIRCKLTTVDTNLSLYM